MSHTADGDILVADSGSLNGAVMDADSLAGQSCSTVAAGQQPPSGESASTGILQIWGSLKLRAGALHVFNLSSWWMLAPSSAEQDSFGEVLGRHQRKMSSRECVTELSLSVAFVAATISLWLLLPPGPFPLWPALVCLATIIVAFNIRIDTPFGFTSPAQLAFVPMLFIVPLALIPLAIVFANVCASLPALISGRMRPTHLIHALPNAGFALGPVAVFACAGIAPKDAGATLLLTALAAQLVVDYMVLLPRMLKNERKASHLGELWTLGIDVTFSIVAILSAEEIERTHLAVLALLPLFALVALFARERRGRLKTTLALARTRKALLFQTLHDPVTGLANRRALADRLEQALLGLRRRRDHIALLFIDLDDFKGVNDTYGHETGDRVLVEVGCRLKAIAREGDTVARFGGDEFVILCLDTDSDSRGVTVGHRLLDTLKVPLHIDGHTIKMGGSLGIATTNDPDIGSSHLLRQADMSMYEAKRSGRGCLREHTVLHDYPEKEYLLNPS